MSRIWSHRLSGRTKSSIFSVRLAAEKPTFRYRSEVAVQFVHRARVGRTGAAYPNSRGGFRVYFSALMLSQASGKVFVQRHLGPFQIAARVTLSQFQC